MKKIAFPFIPTLFMLFISCTSKNTDIPVCDNSGIIWGSTFEYENSDYYINNKQFSKRISLDKLYTDIITLKSYALHVISQYDFNNFCIDDEVKNYRKNDNYLYEIDLQSGSERYISLTFYSDFQYLEFIRVHNSKCFFLGTSDYEKFQIITFNIKTNQTTYSNFFQIEKYKMILGVSEKYLYFDNAYYDLDTFNIKNYPFKMKYHGGVLNPEDDRIVYYNLNNIICIYDVLRNKIINTGISRDFDYSKHYFIPESLYYVKNNVLYYSVNSDPMFLFVLSKSYEFTEWYAYNLETKETVKLNCPDKHGYIIGFTK